MIIMTPKNNGEAEKKSLNISECFLVGGLEHFLFSHILGIIIPIDVHIFQRGRYTTNQMVLVVNRVLVFPRSRDQRKNSSALSPLDPYLLMPRVKGSRNSHMLHGWSTSLVSEKSHHIPTGSDTYPHVSITFLCPSPSGNLT